MTTESSMDDQCKYRPEFCEERSSFIFFWKSFSMLCPASDFDTEYIESFFSTPVSTKSRFLSHCGGGSALQSIFFDTIPMVDQQLFSFHLSKFIFTWSDFDHHHEEWIIHSSSNTAFWDLRTEIERDDECFSESENKQIGLCENHSIGYHG